MANQKASSGSGIVWCHDSGSTCVTFTDVEVEPDGPLKVLAPFARVHRDSPVFDGALDDLSVRLNESARAACLRGRPAQDGNAGLKLGFLRTGSGFLPVWKREVAADQRLADLVDVESLTDLDAMTNEQLNAYLRLEMKDGKDGGDWRSYTVSGGVYHCSGSGMGCFVTAIDAAAETTEELVGPLPAGDYFPTVQQDSPLYDPVLSALTAELNRAVSETQTREGKLPERDGQRIGIAITGRGLLPVWKVISQRGSNTGHDPDAVDVTALSEEQREAFLRLR